MIGCLLEPNRTGRRHNHTEERNRNASYENKSRECRDVGMAARLTGLLLAGLLVASCGAEPLSESQASSSSPPTELDTTTIRGTTTTAPDDCPTWEGYPVIWADYYEYDGDQLSYVWPDGEKGGTWRFEDSRFWLLSAYWAHTPNAMFVPHRESRGCVQGSDQWVVAAFQPSAETPDESDQVGDFDAELWDRVTAHPWRLVAYGGIGDATRTPDYGGLVLYGDEITLSLSACALDTYVTQTAGTVVDPYPFPNFDTSECWPPPGMDQGAIDVFSVKVNGKMAIDDEMLTLTDADNEFRFEAVTLAEFENEVSLRDQPGPADPAAALRAEEASSWEEFDHPPPPTLPETTLAHLPTGNVASGDSRIESSSISETTQTTQMPPRSTE